jgi:hypothetical protein
MRLQTETIEQVYEAMTVAQQYKVQYDMVAYALQYIKENPHVSVKDALDAALRAMDI